jgi:hypothetical protein
MPLLVTSNGTTLAPGLAHGVYSYREAAGLLRVTTQRVTRWSDGYVFRLKRGYGQSAPILQTKREKGVLSFYELMELFFVREYVALKVSLQHIRDTAEALAETCGPYPFSRAELIVSGRELIVQKSEAILHRADVGQIVADFALTFSAEVSFRKNVASRYFPFGHAQPSVYLDREIHAGEPVVTDYAVPTRAVFALWEREQDLVRVAEYHDIEVEEAARAVRYESEWRLAA